MFLIMMESSGVNCFFTVMKKEGMVGMYKGVIPEMFRALAGLWFSQPTTGSSFGWVLEH